MQCPNRTCRGRCACASVPAVISALVNITSVSSIVGLTATLGLLVGVQETAATVHTLDQAGTTGRSCGVHGQLLIQGEKITMPMCSVCGTTHRQETVLEWAAPHMCRCPACVHWDKCTLVHWGSADTATRISSCRRDSQLTRTHG